MRLGLAFLLSCAAACSADSTRAPAELSSALAENAAGSGGTGVGVASAPLQLARAYTEHLGQLTGRPPNDYGKLGMTGTDLGVTFQRGDKLYFLFGDSWTDVRTGAGPDRKNKDLDSIAWASAARPDQGMPKLNWFKRANPPDQFLPFTLPGVNLGAMSLPMEGIAIGTRNYIFFHTRWTGDRGTNSVLAHAEGEAFDALTLDHDRRSDKFMSVSAVQEGEYVYIFGAGVYRQSAVYLARVRADSITDRDSWRYYHEPAPGQPGDPFVAGEQNADAIVNERCVGEISVRKHEALNAFLMTYNCGQRTPNPQPQDVVLRTAQRPEGPWSDALTLLGAGEGNEIFLHANPQSAGHDDGLDEPERQGYFGDVYGPYLIPAWFSEPAPGVHEIVYTLSSWNPYEVHLIRSVLVEPGASAPPPVRGANLPRASLQNPSFADGTLAGWQTSGSKFTLFRDGFNGNQWTVSTFAGSDAATGSAWQDFDIDAQTSRLEFVVHGGHAQVALYEGDVLLRASRGHDDNNRRDRVSWDLEPLRGKHVRLVIEDNQTDSWGFIGVSGFTLR